VESLTQDLQRLTASQYYRAGGEKKKGAFKKNLGDLLLRRPLETQDSFSIAMVGRIKWLHGSGPAVSSNQCQIRPITAVPASKVGAQQNGGDLIHAAAPHKQYIQYFELTSEAPHYL
jgi:hypothetical protein